MATLSQFFRFAGIAAGNTLGAADDINNDAAIVFATINTGLVGLAQRSALARGKAHATNGMMRTPLGGLGSVATHSYYHMGATIQLLPKNTRKGPQTGAAAQIQGSEVA